MLWQARMFRTDSNRLAVELWTKAFQPVVVGYSKGAEDAYQKEFTELNKKKRETHHKRYLERMKKIQDQVVGNKGGDSL